ncbi:MAG TPA: C40 family peptidase [Candidatus Saccharimonadales bacterium]|nr:C40 family peptidase [Candidatus Saccharimonadales bacterium]
MKKKIITTLAALMFLSVGSAAHAQHYVKKDETLAKIAKEYKMKLPDLISLNPHIKNPNHIVPGDYIVIRTESEKAADLIDYAKSLQYTTAYAYGGQNFPYSTDCSGWVQGVYKKFGVQLPRVSRDQAKTGKPVTYEELQPGDLMFFSTAKDHTITHVGIFLGGDQGGYWISNLNTAKDVQILPKWGKWSRNYFMWGTRYKL